ncbi:MAG: hypothetical protein ACO1QS_15350 [Verrucomicrobiota bacterium]
MRKTVVISMLLALGLMGCKKSEETPEANTQNAAPQQAGPVLVEAKDGASVSIGAPPAGAPSQIAAPQIAPPGAPPQAPAGGNGGKDEYNGEVVMRDDNGTRLDGEALLKRAMMQHVEGKGHPYPERIEELVEKGTLKALPAAPNGQKWAIDPATKQIVLK